MQTTVAQHCLLHAVLDREAKQVAVVHEVLASTVICWATRGLARTEVALLSHLAHPETQLCQSAMKHLSSDLHA